MTTTKWILRAMRKDSDGPPDEFEFSTRLEEGSTLKDDWVVFDDGDTVVWLNIDEYRSFEYRPFKSRSKWTYESPPFEYPTYPSEPPTVSSFERRKDTGTTSSVTYDVVDASKVLRGLAAEDAAARRERALVGEEADSEDA